MKTLVDAARDYRRSGWSIFPNTTSKEQTKGKKQQSVPTWLRKRTSSQNYGTKMPGGIFPALTSDQLRDWHNLGHYTVSEDHGWTRKWLPRLSNRLYAHHMAGTSTFYFQGNGKSSDAETLFMGDIDCHKKGTLAGAIAFAQHLKETYFPELCFELSTNGNGVHFYLVLQKLGWSAKDVKAQLRVFEKWLKEEMVRAVADIEDVEVKGTPAVYEYDHKTLVCIVSGTFAKLPRADVRTTTKITMAGLANFKPTGRAFNLDVTGVGSKSRKRRAISSSTSWRPNAITTRDLADMPTLRGVASKLGIPSVCSGRVAVTNEDVAIFLLLLRFFTNHMPGNDALPWTRFSRFWAALYQAGDVSRAFDAKRFSAIRNHLSSFTVDEEPLLLWIDPTFGIGRACRWRASAKLMSLLVVPEEDTSSSLLLGTISRRPSWKPRAISGRQYLAEQYR
jgi:hypothetical protein